MKRNVDHKRHEDLIMRGLRNAQRAYLRVMKRAERAAKDAAGDAWDATIAAAARRLRRG